MLWADLIKDPHDGSSWMQVQVLANLAATFDS